MHITSIVQNFIFDAIEIYVFSAKSIDAIFHYIEINPNPSRAF